MTVFNDARVAQLCRRHPDARVVFDAPRRMVFSMVPATVARKPVTRERDMGS